MNKTTSIIIAFIVIIGGIWYISTRKASVTNNIVKQEVQPVVVTQATSLPMATNVRAFTVEGGNFKFTPNTISVNQGDTVKITFKNTEGFHDFVLDEYQLRTKQIPAGQEETMEFVADKVGTFEFYCSVGTHRKMGMVGTLEVK
ncbi:MAG: cupredoxin domain-containing protein [Microgenomates group bacterium]